MELFQEQIDSTKNWLPYDGTVHYWGKIFNQNRILKEFKIIITFPLLVNTCIGVLNRKGNRIGHFCYDII